MKTDIPVIQHQVKNHLQVLMVQTHNLKQIKCGEKIAEKIEKKVMEINNNINALNTIHSHEDRYVMNLVCRIRDVALMNAVLKVAIKTTSNEDLCNMIELILELQNSNGNK